LDEKFGIRVQHKQLSLERKHFYRVEAMTVAKRCRDEIKAALAAKPTVDLVKLRNISRDLRENVGPASASPIIAWTTISHCLDNV
jgi:hypothetical protein